MLISRVPRPYRSHLSTHTRQIVCSASRRCVCECLRMGSSIGSAPGHCFIYFFTFPPPFLPHPQLIALHFVLAVNWILMEDMWQCWSINWLYRCRKIHRGDVTNAVAALLSLEEEHWQWLVQWKWKYPIENKKGKRHWHFYLWLINDHPTLNP